jgi:hypothetical protein
LKVGWFHLTHGLDKECYDINARVQSLSECPFAKASIFFRFYEADSGCRS